MIRYIKEIRISILLLNLLLVILTVLTVCTSTSAQKQYDKKITEYSKSKGTLINRLEFSDNDFYNTDNVFNISAESYVSMYKQLISCPSFELYEIKYQPIEIYNTNDNMKNFFSEIMGHTESYEKENGKIFQFVDCTQMSENCFEAYPIHIDEGRYFDKYDYILHRDSPIRMLMGYSYKDYYNIGDLFQGNYLGYETEFEIVGFMTQDSYYCVGDDQKYTDRMIIIPFISVPSDEINILKEFTFSQYINKITTYIHVREGYTMDDVRNDTKRITDYYGLEQFEYYGLMIKTEFGSTKIDIDSVRFISTFLRRMLYFIFIAFSTVNFKLFHTRRRTVAAKIICGIRRSTIALQWQIENIIYIIIAVLIAAIMGVTPTKSDLVVFISMQVVSLIVSIIILSGRYINRILTEEEKNVG